LIFLEKNEIFFLTLILLSRADYVNAKKFWRSDIKMMWNWKMQLIQLYLHCMKGLKVK
jgi:hypothetical protein